MKSAIIHDGKTWWWVRIHDSQAELIAAANRMNVQRRTFFKEPKDTLACFQPSALHYPWTDGHLSEKPVPEGYVGTMRFTTERLDAEIMAHESLHCAMAIYRRRFSEDVQLGEDCGPREEELAHILGRVVENVTDSLYKLGVW